MRDKYNLNNMPAGVGGFEEMEQGMVSNILTYDNLSQHMSPHGCFWVLHSLWYIYKIIADDSAVIPGMGPEDRVENTQDLPEVQVSSSNMDGAIPGLDFDMDDKNCKQPLMKKVFSSLPTHLMLL